MRLPTRPNVVRPVTKWQRQALRPREIPDAVFEAFRQMRTGRPRPVLIEIPPEAGVEREEIQLRNPAPISRIVPSPDQLREAARIISQSRLPIIYAGGGVARSDAEPALVELAEATNIPVVTSSGGKGTIPDSHPLSYGSCFSPRGERQEMNQLYEVMQSADVVIGIGARFSLGNPAGESSVLININIDDFELTRVQSNTIPLHGDARATIEALLPYLIEAGAGERSSPAEAVTAARRLIAYYDIRLQEPQYPVLEMINGTIPEDAFIAWDATQFGFYARTHYQVNHPKTFMDSGYSYNLGWAFPAALGAKVAEPDRPVFCMVGDGGFMFNSSELSTAVKYGINVITIVWRNDSYGNVARDLDEFFAGTYETDLHNPDLVQVRRVIRRCRDEGGRPHGTPKADSPRPGMPGPRNHRRTLRTHANTSPPSNSSLLLSPLDPTAAGSHTFLNHPEQNGEQRADLLPWKNKFQGTGVAEAHRLRVLEEEKRKLRQLAADLSHGQADAVGRAEKQALKHAQRQPRVE